MSWIWLLRQGNKAGRKDSVIKKKINWNIVDLQYYISLKCTM